MTQSTPPIERRFSRPTFADVIGAEHAQIQAGTAQPCGDTCLCHGGLTCARAAHPHDPDVDMGENAPRGNVVPHTGYDVDGQLIQWTCHDEATRALTADDHATMAAKARADHSRALLAGLDPDALRTHLDLGAAA